MSVIVEVRAVESVAPDGRKGTYYRGGRIWEPGWHEHVVDESLLDLISNDRWLEVRRLDPRTQAEKKMQHAIVLDVQATQAETSAKSLRAQADELMKEAEAAMAAVGNEPPAPPPPAATPFKDALIAAMPGDVRRQIEETMPLATAAAQLSTQLVGTPVQEPKAKRR